MLNKSWLSFCLVLLAVLSIFRTIDGCFTAKVKITVSSAIPGDYVLSAHCKSGDDDLTERILHFNQGFDWTFCVKPSTLFWCNVARRDAAGKDHGSGGFQAYNQGTYGCEESYCEISYTADAQGVLKTWQNGEITRIITW
ncbi:hypothetical protein Scep_008424 [Stephania cephalantha]|uniref:S-protein homolog n=1 Tax=Stephania cephalantha TaxID=152367 RepID=A0AAP0KBX8_9MAGN